MSTRILRQWDPNTSYRLVPLEEDGEATASELPVSTISKDQGKLKQRRITKNHSPTSRGPTNPVPHTSDLSGPSNLPPYHPKVSPTYCLEHPTIQDPLSAYSKTLRDFKPIFDTLTVGGYGSPQQCICCC
jgi:hypothetical protein